MDWASLLEDGRITHQDALASVDDVVRPGGDRVLILRLAGGLSLDVLPDRGLDLGAAWSGSVPLAWRSPQSADPGPGHGWNERFLGGLLATCGPDNIGAPRGASGQHGTHHLTRAEDVRWWRQRAPEGIDVHVRGRITHSSSGSWIVIEREIVTGTARPCVEVRDTVRNEGNSPAAVPLLYHVNLGAPMLRPGARMSVDAGTAVLRDPCPPGQDALSLPHPRDGLDAVVAEHPGIRSHDGWARATLTETGLGADVAVEWRTDTLPRLCTWNNPARGGWVLGVEPTNAPLFGSERELPHAGAPVLQPGHAWNTVVRVAVVPTLAPSAKRPTAGSAHPNNQRRAWRLR